MTQITTYVDLRLAVSEFVGNRNITDAFPRLVQYAENWLNRNLRHRKMLTTATVTMTSGSGPLPSDFIEMQTISIGTCVLRADSIENVQQMASHLGRYAIDGANLLIAGQTGSQSITYYAKLTELSAVTDTNWLLSESPELYHAAVNVEAARFLREPELLDYAERDRARAIGELHEDNYRAQWSNATVRVAGVRP